MSIQLTRDEFAYLAHEESCPDCLGHEDGVEKLRNRINVKDLERRMAEARQADPTLRYFTMECV